MNADYIISEYSDLWEFRYCAYSQSVERRVIHDPDTSHVSVLRHLVIWVFSALLYLH